MLLGKPSFLVSLSLFLFAKRKTLFRLKKKRALLNHHRKTAEVLSEDVKSVVAVHCKMVIQSDTPRPVLLPPVKVSLFEKQTGTQNSLLPPTSASA